MHVMCKNHHHQPPQTRHMVLTTTTTTTNNNNNSNILRRSKHDCMSVYCQLCTSEIALQRSCEMRHLIGNNVAGNSLKYSILETQIPVTTPEGLYIATTAACRETASGIVENTKCVLCIKKCYKLSYPVKSHEAGHETQKQMTSNACALQTRRILCNVCSRPRGGNRV